MACPSGQHQHKGADGVHILRCHSISQKHTNPKTQNYHLMSVQSSGDNKKRKRDLLEPEEEVIINDDDYVDEEEEKREEQKTKREQSEIKRKAKIESDKKKIRAFLEKITRKGSTFRPLLVPLMGFLISYDKMSPMVAQLKEKARNNKEKEMAETYEKTVDEIVNIMPDKNVNDWTEEDLVEMEEKIVDRMTKLAEAVKKKGTKLCPEYAQYRAYWDYVGVCEERQNAINQRLNAKGIDGAPSEGEQKRLAQSAIRALFADKMRQSRNGAPAPMTSTPSDNMYR